MVHVSLSGVNPTDWKARDRIASPTSHVDPTGIAARRPRSRTRWITPHHDGVGVIVAIGTRVPAHRLGERVWMWQAQWGRDSGTAAEYVTLPVQHAVPLPQDVGDDLAAGLGIPAMTAHYCLFADGPLDPTEHVLVHGGAGAVGHFAIELARHAGAQVATTVSSPEKAAIAEAAGADLVVNYNEDDVAGALVRWAPNGVTRILEVDLPSNIELDATVASPGASVQVYAHPARPTVMPWRLLEANLRLEFMLVYTISDAAKRRAVAGVANALEAGALTSLPVTKFALSEVADAHRAVRGNLLGKALIDVQGT
nr:NADPH:quinone reductase [Nocardioides thalensis]